MIYTIKKFLHIAFECKARPRFVPTDLSRHVFYGSDTSVRSKTNTAGKGVSDERRLKNRVDDGVDSVMKNTVTHCGLVDVTTLGLVDVETAIRPVLVGFDFEFAVELKNVFLQTPFKRADIPPFRLVAPKSLPRREQILRRNNFVK